MVLKPSPFPTALPVPLAAEQVVVVCRGVGPWWWHYFSFNSSQQIHDKVRASQI